MPDRHAGYTLTLIVPCEVKVDRTGFDVKLRENFLCREGRRVRETGNGDGHGERGQGNV